MARKVIQVTSMVSDLTGREDQKADTPDPVKVTVNGKSANLDLFRDELDALLALVTDKNGAPLRKLLAPAAAPAASGRKASGGNRQAKHSDQENQEARDFMAAHGVTHTRGKIPNWAYARDADAARKAAEAAGNGSGSAPAGKPAAA